MCVCSRAVQWVIPIHSPWLSACVCVCARGSERVWAIEWNEMKWNKNVNFSSFNFLNIVWCWCWCCYRTRSILNTLLQMFTFSDRKPNTRCIFECICQNNGAYCCESFVWLMFSYPLFSWFAYHTFSYVFLSLSLYLFLILCECVCVVFINEFHSWFWICVTLFSLRRCSYANHN